MDAAIPPVPSPNAPKFISWGVLWRAAACGVVLLASSLLFSWFLSATPPFQMFSDRFTLLLPAQAFDKLLNAFLYWSKPLLLLGLSATWLAIGAAIALGTAAVLWRKADSSAVDPIRDVRSREIAIVAGAAALPFLLAGFVIAPVSNAGLWATETFAGPVRFGFAGALASAVYGLALYRAFAAPPAAFEPAPDVVTATRPGIARRDFMLMSGTAVMGAIGGAILAKDVSGLLANARGGGAALGGGTDVERGDTDVTPAESFYIVSKNFGDPEVDAHDWRLKIEGLVDKPLTLSLDDIKAMSSVQQYVTLECISNEIGGDLISNGQWTGVPLADVIKMAAPKSDAAWVLSEAADGYTESMPIGDAMGGEVLLVYHLNGQALTHKHGYPLRLIYPNHYGMKMPKWITKLELVREDTQGYWVERGWDEQAIVRTMSKINHPTASSDIPRGADIQVRGVAFAGMRGIKTVEVSVDQQETWHAVDLKPRLSKYAWTLWSWTWRNPEPGFQRIFVRAVDGEGNPQENTGEGTFPSGATGYHSVLVKIV